MSSEENRTPSRPNLVIVRAGDGSLHPNWLNGPGEERNWDLIVSYFGNDPDKFRDGDWVRIDRKGPKIPPLYELLSARRDLIDKYGYIWLPDDDLACTCEQINRMFEICHAEKLDLAQPSLSHDSYFALAVTLHNSCFRLRYTSFVELMAPCYSAPAMSRLLESFAESTSGYGLEELWVQLLGEEAAIAIIDAVQIRHTRPMGGPLYKSLAAVGSDPWTDLERVFAKHGITRRRFWVRSGVTKAGQKIPDGFRLLCLYSLGLLRGVPSWRMKRREIPRAFITGIYQQIIGRRP